MERDKGDASDTKSSIPFQYMIRTTTRATPSPLPTSPSKPPLRLKRAIAERSHREDERKDGGDAHDDGYAELEIPNRDAPERANQREDERKMRVCDAVRNGDAEIIVINRSAFQSINNVSGTLSKMYLLIEALLTRQQQYDDDLREDERREEEHQQREDDLRHHHIILQLKLGHEKRRKAMQKRHAKAIKMLKMKLSEQEVALRRAHDSAEELRDAAEAAEGQADALLHKMQPKHGHLGHKLKIYGDERDEEHAEGDSLKSDAACPKDDKYDEAGGKNNTKHNEDASDVAYPKPVRLGMGGGADSQQNIKADTAAGSDTKPSAMVCLLTCMAATSLAAMEEEERDDQDYGDEPEDEPEQGDLAKDRASRDEDDEHDYGDEQEDEHEQGDQLKSDAACPKPEVLGMDLGGKDGKCDELEAMDAIDYIGDDGRGADSHPLYTGDAESTDGHVQLAGDVTAKESLLRINTHKNYTASVSKDIEPMMRCISCLLIKSTSNFSKTQQRKNRAPGKGGRCRLCIETGVEQKQSSWLNLEEEESEPYGSGKDDAHSSAEEESFYDEDTKESEDEYIPTNDIEPHGSGKDDAHSSAEQESVYDEETKESEDFMSAKLKYFRTLSELGIC